MAIRIEGKIVDYAVGGNEEPQQEQQAAVAVENEAAQEEDNVVPWHEMLKRP